MVEGAKQTSCKPTLIRTGTGDAGARFMLSK